jgi:hypothetical protein
MPSSMRRTTIVTNALAQTLGTRCGAEFGKAPAESAGAVSTRIAVADLWGEDRDGITEEEGGGFRDSATQTGEAVGGGGRHSYSWSGVCRL